MSESNPVLTSEPLTPAAWLETVASEVVAAVAELAPEATALLAECREGALVFALASRFPHVRRVMAVEGDRDVLNRARAVGEDVEEPPLFFAAQSLPSLQFADDVFDVAVCAAGIVTTAQLMNAAVELARVVRPGGHVLLAGVDAASFPLLEALAREATWASSAPVDEDADAALAARIDEAAMGAVAERAPLRPVAAGAFERAVTFGRATSVLADSLVARDLFGAWRVLLPSAAHAIDGIPQWLDALFAESDLVDRVGIRWGVWEVLEEDLAPIEDADVLAAFDEDDAPAVADAADTHFEDTAAHGDAPVVELDGSDVELLDDAEGDPADDAEPAAATDPSTRES